MDSFDVIAMLERIKKEVKTKEPHELVDMINSEIERIEDNAEVDVSDIGLIGLN